MTAKEVLECASEALKIASKGKYSKRVRIQVIVISEGTFIDLHGEDESAGVVKPSMKQTDPIPPQGVFIKVERKECPNHE